MEQLPYNIIVQVKSPHISMCVAIRDNMLKLAPDLRVHGAVDFTVLFQFKGLRIILRLNATVNPLVQSGGGGVKRFRVGAMRDKLNTYKISGARRHVNPCQNQTACTSMCRHMSGINHFPL